MIRSNILILFRFLAGILLVQGAAAVLTYAALTSDRAEVWLLLGALALAASLLVTFWFASAAGQLRKEALARQQRGFSQEREAMRAKAERVKSRVIKESSRQLAREKKRIQHRANFKIGTSVALAVGLGVLMLLTQLVTVGLLTLATTGGALGGYLLRARQERSALPAATPERLDPPVPSRIRTSLLRKMGASRLDEPIKTSGTEY